MFVKLQGRLVLVVGGGSIAARKNSWSSPGACPGSRLAPQVNVQIADWVRAGEIDWVAKEFELAICRVRTSPSLPHRCHE